jgi:hypothetical protein
MFGIEKDYQKLLEQVYGPLGEKPQMTEIEKVKEEIKVLEKKLSFLEELEKTKSSVEEAFKDNYGVYPNELKTTDDFNCWKSFKRGYNAAFAISTAKEVVEEVQEEPKDNEWKSVALRFGEKLVSVGPCGYYDFTPEEWLKWALNAYEKLADDWLKLLEKERIKSQNQVKKLQEKNWYDDVKTNLKPHWEPKPQNENEESQKDYKVGEYQEQEVEPFMANCIITGNPPNGYSSWSDWYNELGSKGILVNLRISSNECKPTLKSPEETEQSLKEAFREADKQGAASSTKSKTLTNLIERWWCDVFTIHSDWDMETSIDDLVDRIQLWLPKEQFANSQNEYVELTVEGFNDCVNKIKDNLR